ncbi:MAG: heparan-alpha-glucosaminide N-acetyltransferase domain-containing protein [Bacteroidales bacterium]|nr:heparan-alpha-glucosaminide N-acetyltransferase domain-containing protein [Bacteroidales bacterium]
MKKRYLSLDILRGITVAFMCIVNNPGSWGKIFPPLEHAGWVGCTPTDLVYPFFLFCVGCAMAFSYSKFDSFNKDSFLKLLKRSIGIFVVGLLINLYPFYPTSPHDEAWTFGQNYLYWLQHKRILGVLQRIAMAYFIGGTLALWLRKPGKIIAGIIALCVGYTAVLLAFGSEPGAFTLEGNIAGKLDIALFGENHVYHGYGIPFDPEGILGSFPAAGNVLIGYLIGSLILSSSRRYAEDSSLIMDAPVGVVSRIFVWGVVSLAFAEILSIWIPINKPLWSASYIFYTCGWAMLTLGFLAFCVDVKGVEKPFFPFKVMGMNALVAFVLSGVIAKSYQFVGWSPSRVFGANEYLSLVYALIFATTIFLILFVLYKKKIFIKL